MIVEGCGRDLPAPPNGRGVNQWAATLAPESNSADRVEAQAVMESFGYDALRVLLHVCSERGPSDSVCHLLVSVIAGISLTAPPVPVLRAALMAAEKEMRFHTEPTGRWNHILPSPSLQRDLDNSKRKSDRAALIAADEAREAARRPVVGRHGSKRVRRSESP